MTAAEQPAGALGDAVAPCGDRCPGECGWNPADPDDPCTPATPPTQERPGD